MMTRRKIVAVGVLAIALIGLAAGVSNQSAADPPQDAPREIKVPAGATVEVAVPVAPAEKPREAVKKNDRNNAAIELQARVNKPFDKAIAFDRHTPLKVALEFCSDVFDISIVIDETAFQSDGAKVNVGDLPVALQKMDKPSLRTVLRLLLGQIPDAAYLIRPDFIEITTVKRLRAEVLRAEEPSAGPCPFPIHVNFNRRPLQEALDELADLAEVNIVLDARVADKAKTEVTARLRNVSIDTAVQLLADMVDLHPVTIGNVIYITSAANAERFLAQQEKRKQLKEEQKKEEQKKLESKQRETKPDA